MPRYFFATANAHRDEDHEGVELSGAHDARIAAIVFAGEYLRDNPELIDDGQRFRVEVRDDAGAILLVVTIHAEGPDQG